MNLIQEKEDLFVDLQKVKNEVGNTPLVDLSILSPNPNVKIFAKKEWEQIGGSVKARAAFEIISKAIENGELGKNKIFLDASSGNTAIAYACVLNELSIKAVIVLPENASDERKLILRNLGVDLILSSPFEGTDGAQELAKKIYKNNPDEYYYADQYNNDNNWKSHYNSTAQEIFNQTNEEITHFAASLGTTGTFVGTGRRLKKLNNDIQLIQLQPSEPMHGLEGWKHLETAKVPGIFDSSLADFSINVDSQNAIENIRTVFQKTGLRLSPSASASVLGAMEFSKTIEKGVVVTVLADNGDKYGEIYNELKI